MERRNHFGGLRLEERDGSSLPLIHGMGAIFYDADRRAETEFELTTGLVERIHPPAFAEIGTQDVRALNNHDPRLLLGRTPNTLSLRVTNTGLEYTIDPPDTQVGRDMVESIRRGDISGSSFSFTLRERPQWDVEERDGQQVRVRNICTAVTTFDVGPATFPAYSGTSVGLRGQALEEVEAEYRSWAEEIEAAAQKDAGLSRGRVLRLHGA